MKIGVTGTRDGLTDAQVKSVYHWAASLPHWTEFHHGCCYGADVEVAEEFDKTRVFVGGQMIHAHPSDIASWTDFQAVSSADVQWKPKPPHARNKDIVNATDVLIACPKGEKEELRSGTWSTVRYARSIGRRIVFVWPSGLVTEEAAS